jgi:hypothetical protein
LVSAIIPTFNPISNFFFLEWIGVFLSKLLLQHIEGCRMMRLGLSVGWMLVLLGGFSLLNTRSASAIEAIDYTPGSSFSFNPIAGNPNQDFGSVNLQSDSSTGWILQVRSLNHSALKHSASNYTINYTLTVDGASVDLSSGNNVMAKTTTTLTCNQPDVCRYPIQGTINAGAIDGKPAGAYSDTLIFTLLNQ